MIIKGLILSAIAMTFFLVGCTVEGGPLPSEEDSTAVEAAAITFSAGTVID